MVDTETIPPRHDDGSSPRRNRLAMIAAAVVGATVLLAGGAWLAAQLVASDGGWDVVAGQAVTVSIEPGTSARTIYADLQDAGVARADDLEAAARSLGVEDRLRAGTFALETDMDPASVVEILARGSNVADGATFTVVEGWTVDRIVEALAAATPYTQAEFQQVLRSDVVTSPYLPPIDGPVDALNRWEGLLYPATYPISDASTPTSILRAMADEMARRLTAIDWSRVDALGVSRHEALVVASLVEREAGTDDERPMIASVVYNRLAEPMRLQIDATVIYALGYNPGRVTADHLAVDSPWNTYRVDGLPPTPIGTASLASIEAAVDPATTPYLFYVLGSEDGSHLFAETYEQHQANIEAARDAGVLP